MTRVILAPNDDLTPFDLRAQIFRVNMELSVHYRGQNFFHDTLTKAGSQIDANYRWRSHALEPSSIAHRL